MQPDHPFDRVVNALQERGCRPRDTRNTTAAVPQRRALCPAHADLKPSLVVSYRSDRVLLRCFAGCRTTAVVQALGLKLADLFAGPPDRNAPKPSIIATYNYATVDGELLQKVRMIPKSFRWRRPDPSGRHEWVWGLGGLVPMLYRLPQLTTASGIPTLYICEGEKAVDHLNDLGLHATCPPVGANSWHDDWTTAIVNINPSDVVVLADRDDAGERHAERVAAALDAALITVTVIHFSQLQKGADVVDYFKGGYTLADLEKAVLRAPHWSPAIREQLRADRRRAKTRERVRRLRAERKRNAPNVSEENTGCNAVYVNGCNAGNAVTLPNVLHDHVTKVAS